MTARRPIRVLVVDDSAVMRKLLTAVLSRDPDIEVVATAVDGIVALRKLARFHPDVVTLDLEMPGMDGFDVLREMVSLRETPVIVVSAHTQESAVLSVTALSLGAVDVVAKPRGGMSGGVDLMAADLLAKVRAVAGRRWRRPPVSTATPGRPAKGAIPSRERAQRVVAIGVSTGGPAALAYVMPRIPADVAAAFIIVQHMPEGFTAMLAHRLDHASSVEVHEARDGDVLRSGRVLVAPGGRHLRVRRMGNESVALVSSGVPVSGHCPSADVLFQSVAVEFGSRAVGVILTGMGEDGAAGLLAIQRAGGQTLAQDEESSVVFGMPKAAILRGAVDRVLPLEKIPEAIVAAVSRPLGLESVWTPGRTREA